MNVEQYQVAPKPQTKPANVLL